MILYRRLVHALREEGLRSTFLRAFKRRSSNRRLVTLPAVDPLHIHPFDRLHGTDTSGIIPDMTHPSGQSSAYLGISPSTLTQALNELEIPKEDFTFVDIGCGKGRALLLAAQLPFPRLIGVEFSPQLCAIARANLARQPEATGRITILHRDATTVVFPMSPLLLFLYDPFKEDVLIRFLESLESQLRKAPRETLLLYAANGRTRTIERFPFLKLVYDKQIPLSAEDAAIDQLAYDLQFPPDAAVERHHITHEHYTLYRSTV